ncbi:MAG: hypothetical protein Q9167_007037 [Letrouitia subvulpina]
MSRNSSSISATPIEDAIRQKITSALAPVNLSIINTSYLHAHHPAMQNVTSPETHFRLHIVSDTFRAKTQMARHRVVYGLLKEEMGKEGGVHALELRTRTVQEDEKEREGENEKES